MRSETDNDGLSNACAEFDALTLLSLEQRLQNGDMSALAEMADMTAQVDRTTARITKMAKEMGTVKIK